MRSIKILKSYQAMTRTLKSPDEIAYQDDLAITDFRSFHRVADLHCQRVMSEAARNVMLEVLEDLKEVLAKNTQVI